MSLAVDSRGNDLRPSRHVCIFRFAELTDREVEVVSISRDTTESDLKQRRELVGGGSVDMDYALDSHALLARCPCTRRLVCCVRPRLAS